MRISLQPQVWSNAEPTWNTNLRPMGTPRSSHCCVCLDNKYIFVLGGWGKTSGVQTRLKSVERYDIAANRYDDVG